MIADLIPSIGFEAREPQPETRPRCACHGEPMTARSDQPRNPWRCSVSHEAAVRRWELANPKAVGRMRTRREVKLRGERMAAKVELMAEILTAVALGDFDGAADLLPDSGAFA